MIYNFNLHPNCLQALRLHTFCYIYDVGIIFYCKIEDIIIVISIIIIIIIIIKLIVILIFNM